MRFRHLPFRRKILVLLLLTSSLAIGVGFIVTAWNQSRWQQQQNTSSMTTLTHLMALNSSAVLLFEDNKFADSLLQGLRAEPQIIAAQLLRKDGSVLASFRVDNAATPHPAIARHSNNDDQKIVTEAVYADNDQVGELRVLIDVAYMQHALFNQLMVLVAVSAVTLLGAGLLSTRLSGVATRPIKDLADTANRIAEQQDFSLRAEVPRARDEIHTLVQRFNSMLEQLQSREILLAKHREHLEQLVAERTEELVHARDAAEAASRAKSDFLATMSHEIRTPLNGVIGMTDLLLGTKMNHEQHRYAEVARRSGEDLLAIINDILDFSKIEAGKLQLEAVPFDLGELVDDIGEKFAQRAHAKSLELIIAPPAHRTFVQGDAVRLRQVLTNLVGNAIKFTDHGEVVLRVQVVAADDDNMQVNFSVQDTGIGLTNEQQKRLFLSFSQADSSTTRKFGGTGLGLAISQRLVQMMDGQIAVTSEPGVGTHFYFQITLPKSADIVRLKHRVLTDMPDVRVLLVDDNQTNLDILAQQLKAWGFDLQLAHTGMEAIGLLYTHAAQGKPFHLMITDMFMPGMDGNELIMRLRSDQLFDRMSVFVLSSGMADMPMSQQKQMHISAYLSKPARQSDLYNAILDCFAKSGELPIPPAEEIHAAVAIVSTTGRHILLAEDHSVNQAVAVAMLSNLGYPCEVAANGKEALARWQRGGIDLILMDCQMPEMDGFEATRLIRRMERDAGKSRLPIIALTANAISGDRERCLASGMDDYMSKPFKQDQLAALLNRWFMASDGIAAVPNASTGTTIDAGVSRNETTTTELTVLSPSATPKLLSASTSDSAINAKAAAKATSQNADQTVDMSVIDINAIDMLRQISPDGSLLQQVIALYLRDSPPLLTALQKGANNNESGTIYRTAHSLKNSSANLGAMRVAELARELETLGRDQQMEGVHYRVVDILDAYEHASAALSALAVDPTSQSDTEQ